MFSGEKVKVNRARTICGSLGRTVVRSVGRSVGRSLAKVAVDPPISRPGLFLEAIGRRPNGFLGLSLNDRTILVLVLFLDHGTVG